MSKGTIVGSAIAMIFVAGIAIGALAVAFGENDLTAEEQKDPKIKDSKGEDVKLTTTKSGLKYADLKVGTGTEAKAGSMVKVHYTGTLTNGNKFDSSLDRNEPFGLTVGNGSVIKGWDEGLQGMKVGGKRKLVIPAELGYGKKGFPPVIPADATLVFEIELLEVR